MLNPPSMVQPAFTGAPVFTQDTLIAVGLSGLAWIMTVIGGPIKVVLPKWALGWISYVPLKKKINHEIPTEGINYILWITHFIILAFMTLHSSKLHNGKNCITLRSKPWVGAQHLKKPANSSDWRQKLWKSRQATAIIWRHNTVVHDYSGTRYSGAIPITGPYENPHFSYYINPIKCAWI